MPQYLSFVASLRDSSDAAAMPDASEQSQSNVELHVATLLLVEAELQSALKQLKAGAYTRPVFSSTSAVLVTPSRVPLSNRLGKIMHPTHPTKCDYVELKRERE
jgi:hypothetical protein